MSGPVISRLGSLIRGGEKHGLLATTLIVRATASTGLGHELLRLSEISFSRTGQ